MSKLTKKWFIFLCDVIGSPSYFPRSSSSSLRSQNAKIIIITGPLGISLSHPNDSSPSPPPPPPSQQPLLTEHLTHAEHASLVHAEREEMGDMAQTMENEEEEEDELPRRSSPASRITFAPKSILRETNQAPATTDPPGLLQLIRDAQEARDALGLSLAAHAPTAPKKSHRQPPPVETVEESSGSEASLVDLTIRTVKRAAAKGKAKKSPPSPSTCWNQHSTSGPKIWYGLEKGRTRVICTSASKKATYESLGYSLAGAFYSAQVAEDWREAVPPLQGPDEDSSLSESDDSPPATCLLPPPPHLEVNVAPHERLAGRRRRRRARKRVTPGRVSIAERGLVLDLALGRALRVALTSLLNPVLRLRLPQAFMSLIPRLRKRIESSVN
jgi:hypothetical protein